MKSSHPLDEPPIRFDVFVKQSIGTVTLDGGELHPFQAALAVLAWHQVTQHFPNGKYEFPGADDDDTVTIHIEHTHNEREAPNVGE